MEINKVDINFKPTLSWIRDKYDELNSLLFRGQLGYCSFEIFTTGRGSQGKYYGYFKMCAPNLKYNRHTHHIFQDSYLYRINITKTNFVSVCNPTIGINGNYTGTEYAFLTTLIHEMCHYYNYMDGIAPSSSHGSEFKNIVYAVCERSNGLFSYDDVINSEVIRNQYKLDDKIIQTKKNRLENKKSKMYAVFAFMDHGPIRLTTTSNKALLDKICDINNYLNPSSVVKILVSNDSVLIDKLFELGYNTNCRKWFYWNVAGKDWLSLLDSVKTSVIYDSSTVNESISRLDVIISEVLHRYKKDVI